MSNRKRPPSAGGDVDAQRLTSGVDDDALGGRAAGNRRDHSERKRVLDSSVRAREKPSCTTETAFGYFCSIGRPDGAIDGISRSRPIDWAATFFLLSGRDPLHPQTEGDVLVDVLVGEKSPVDCGQVEDAGLRGAGRPERHPTGSDSIVSQGRSEPLRGVDSVNTFPRSPKMRSDLSHHWAMIFRITLCEPRMARKIPVIDTKFGVPSWPGCWFELR